MPAGYIESVSKPKVVHMLPWAVALVEKAAITCMNWNPVLPSQIVTGCSDGTCADDSYDDCCLLAAIGCRGAAPRFGLHTFYLCLCGSSLPCGRAPLFVRVRHTPPRRLCFVTGSVYLSARGAYLWCIALQSMCDLVHLFPGQCVLVVHGCTGSVYLSA